MKKFLLLLLLGALAGCSGQNTPPAGNQVLKAANDSANLTPNNPIPANVAPNNLVAANISPTAAPSVAADDKSKIKTFDGKGAVTKINFELGSVELNHEEIKGLMPAMTMEFYVSDKRLLEDLAVGDKVNFVLEDNQGAEQIISIKKAK